MASGLAPPFPRRLEAMLLFATALGLQGCPLSDDYFIDSDPEDSGGSAGSGRAGFGSGGSAAGWFGKGGSAAGSTPSGGVGSTAGSGGGCTDCPSGCSTQQRAGKTYMFCTTDRTFATAQATCTGAGMSLVIIDDAEEDAWVWTTLDRAYLGFQPFGLIGASDQASEGNWSFVDGTQFWNGTAQGSPVGSRYVNWGFDQPNNLSPVTQTEEDCGAITLADGTWNDVRCELDCPFVCESP